MTQKIAVIVVHGLGMQQENFADQFINLLKDDFAKGLGKNLLDNQLVIQSVYWAKLFENKEEDLIQKLCKPFDLHYEKLRYFLIHYLADAVAYQPLESNVQNYQAVHQTISRALHRLTGEAGENAPLCVISHSLGTIIASNYFYDLQNSLLWKPDIYNPDSPLERGDTLSLFYSCGSALPLWSLRYRDFDKPIRVPSKQMQNNTQLTSGEWINFYDKDDILAYPLRSIDDAYSEAVKEDREVNVGNWQTSWNPLSHSGYFTNAKVIGAISKGLVNVWKEVNHVNDSGELVP